MKAEIQYSDNPLRFQLTQQLMMKLEQEKVSVDQTKQNVSREEAAVNRENVRIGKLVSCTLFVRLLVVGFSRYYTCVFC